MVPLLLLGDRSQIEPEPLIVTPILFIVSLPILAREASRSQDRTLFWLLVAALALKLLAALPRHYVAFNFYERADAQGYHDAGVLLANRFSSGDFHTGLRSLEGSDFINLITGVVYTVIGTSSRITGFIVFSWLAFWGQFCFYRAFRIAVPEGRFRLYAVLIFFLPSMWFWPSSIGKDAWMVFTIGLAAYGSARLFTRRVPSGALLAGVGLWLAAFVRPHMAAIFAVSLAIGFIAARRPQGAMRRIPGAKIITVAGLILGAAFMVSRAETFLGSSDVLSPSGLVSTLDSVSERSASGGSEFTPPIVSSPLDLPLATLTVLFRPMLFEASSLQSYAAALEGSFLLLFSIARIRSILAAFTLARDRAYVGLAIVYTGLTIVAFSSFANFGNLVRQRTSLLPLYLVLLALPAVLPPKTTDHLDESSILPAGRGTEVGRP
jgi:hypothetical protein